MKSITIHGIDAPLARLIEARARAEGLSINKTVKMLLERALGVKPSSAEANRHHFEEFCGTWSKTDLEAFEASTRDLGEVDPQDWE